MVFLFLWTLDLLSQGFNFWPLRGLLLGHASPSVSVPPTSSGADFPNAFSSPTRQCVVLVAGRGDTQCDSNQESRPCQQDLSVSFPSVGSTSISLYRLFPLPTFFAFFFIQNPWNTLLNGTNRGQIRTILSFSRFAAGAGDFTSQCRDKRLQEETERWINDEKYFQIAETPAISRSIRPTGKPRHRVFQ